MSDAVPTILDRLLGIDPGAGPVAGSRRRATGRARRIAAMLPREPAPDAWFIASVKEDLRLLLNQRRMVDDLEDEDPLSRSRLGFGVEDLTHVSPDELRRGDRLKAIILKAIERFEPRLSDVRVFVEPAPPSVLEVRLNIAATLTIDAQAQPVRFDTILSLRTREIKMAEERDGAEADRQLSP